MCVCVCGGGSPQPPPVCSIYDIIYDNIAITKGVLFQFCENCIRIETRFLPQNKNSFYLYFILTILFSHNSDFLCINVIF